MSDSTTATNGKSAAHSLSPRVKELDLCSAESNPAQMHMRNKSKQYIQIKKWRTEFERRKDYGGIGREGFHGSPPRESEKPSPRHLSLAHASFSMVAYFHTIFHSKINNNKFKYATIRPDKYHKLTWHGPRCSG